MLNEVVHIVTTTTTRDLKGYKITVSLCPRTLECPI